MPAITRLTAIAGAVAAGLMLAACNSAQSAGAGGGDMSMGNANAPIKFVEVASASCSHCARWNEDVFPAFKKKYIDTGQVHYTLKEFLTPPNDVAAAGFLLARCAGKDKYFTVLDAVFRGQREMFADGTSAGAVPVLRRIGGSVGMNDEQFQQCVGDEKALQALNDRVEKTAREMQVTGTPTFFVNGKKIGEQELPLAQIDAAIAAAKAGK